MRFWFLTSLFAIPIKAWMPKIGGRTGHSFDPPLFRLADAVREKLSLPPPDSDTLAYPFSAYALSPPPAAKMRGFCNWVIPHRVMIGQYPGGVPEPSGPAPEEVREHLRSMVRDAGVNFFCSLQSEVPCQSDGDAWNAAGGKIYLPDGRDRDVFPRPFTHYAPVARSLTDDGGPEIVFLRAPVEDLGVPSSEPLQRLLMRLLEALDEGRVVYLHCWGGRGRAGLVGACLLSLLWPEEMDAAAALDLVQAGYDSRAGAKDMPLALSRSPQTEEQRQFVRNFVKAQRHERMQT